uniref:Profilin n=1 Tax=Strongyloides stercoralis TaxID=6248 RepID=A0A0K0E0N3_STRER
MAKSFSMTSVLFLMPRCEIELKVNDLILIIIIMSGWNAYIDNLMSSSDGIRKAAIIGYPDASVWAHSEGAALFNVIEPELKKFAGLFDNIAAVPTTGADLEGIHYIVPRTEENLIFGKKDKSGFFAAKTKSAILIAVYEGENAVGSEVRSAVEKLANYLTDSGY